MQLREKEERIAGLHARMERCEQRSGRIDVHDLLFARDSRNLYVRTCAVKKAGDGNPYIGQNTELRELEHNASANHAHRHAAHSVCLRYI